MGSFKLGGMTLRSLFGKPETIMYPAQQRFAPEGLKGHIENEVEKCILCGICEKRCPSGAISVDKEAATWSINRYRCVQCGSCTRECPKNCLNMLPTYQKPSTEMGIDAYSVPVESEEEKAQKQAAKAAKLEAALKAKAQRENS